MILMYKYSRVRVREGGVGCIKAGTSLMLSFSFAYLSIVSFFFDTFFLFVILFYFQFCLENNLMKEKRRKWLRSRLAGYAAPGAA